MDQWAVWVPDENEQAHSYSTSHELTHIHIRKTCSPPPGNSHFACQWRHGFPCPTKVPSISSENIGPSLLKSTGCNPPQMQIVQKEAESIAQADNNRKVRASVSILTSSADCNIRRSVSILDYSGPAAGRCTKILIPAPCDCQDPDPFLIVAYSFVHGIFHGYMQMLRFCWELWSRESIRFLERCRVWSSLVPSIPYA